MKLHLGTLKNPVRVVTRVGGLRFKAHDAPEQYVRRPAEITRPVRRMFGLSAAKWFIGVMICEKPETR
jgi:hypothetical protein